jgi:hypothetical protein
MSAHVQLVPKPVPIPHATLGSSTQPPFLTVWVTHLVPAACQHMFGGYQNQSQFATPNPTFDAGSVQTTTNLACPGPTSHAGSMSAHVQQVPNPIPVPCGAGSIHIATNFDHAGPKGPPDCICSRPAATLKQSQSHMRRQQFSHQSCPVASRMCDICSGYVNQ